MKRFRKVYVEITNICNMHCSFCPETTRAKAFMDVKKFEYIAKQIVEYTDYVYLHVKGEPLLHPQLEQILNICDKYSLKVNISTNATLLDKKYKLLKHIRQLNVSLHSFEGKDLNELKSYIDTTLDISEKLASSGVIVRCKLWNANESITNNSYILKELENRYNLDLKDATYEKDIKLKDNIFVSIKTPFVWPDINSANEADGKCYGLRKQIAILVDGTVVPCCVDNNGDINLGNIFENSLDNILNSQKAEKIKRGFENNKCTELLCKKCEYRKNV